MTGKRMWTTRNELLSNGRIIKVAIDSGSAPISFENVLSLWQEDSNFREFFNDLLAASPFSAFRWETPPITTQIVSCPFEFVMLDSPGLARAPDPHAFAEHFDPSEPKDVVEFKNLGGDATMIVPSPSDPHSAYGHIAAFVRQAPLPQRHALWKLVGQATHRRLGTKPVWLSTAGAGVSWLHVRLDDRPKYYGYTPYRDAPVK